MQTKKMSIFKSLIITVCALIFSMAFVIPMTQSEIKKVDAVSQNPITISFSGFPTNIYAIRPYVVLNFIDARGETTTIETVYGLPYNNKVKITPPNGFKGKIEVNCPVYSSVSLVKVTPESEAEQVTQDNGVGSLSYKCYSYSSRAYEYTQMELEVTYVEYGWFVGSTI